MGDGGRAACVFLLKGGCAFDLAIGVGEEVVDLGVECILLKDRDGMAGVGDDPEIRLGDVGRDQNGMGDGDGIVVAADDEGGAFDLMKLVEGDMRLVKVEVDDLEFVVFASGPMQLYQLVVFGLNEMEDEGGQAGGIGPEVGAGESHLLNLIGMADGEEDRVYAAVAPADDVAAIQMKGITEGVEVVDDHFEAEGIAGVVGFAVGAGVDGDDVIVGREIRNLVAHVADGAAVAVEEQERFALTVRFVVELKSAGI